MLPSSPTAQSIPPAAGDQAASERLPLCGPLLHLMRAGWMLIILLTFGLFIFSIPLALAHLANMPLPDRAWFDAYDLPVGLYIYFFLALDILTLLGFSIPAMLIFFSKSTDWMAALVSVALITFGATVTNSLGAIDLGHPGLGKLALLVRGMGIASTLFVLYLFPDGRFIPRWTRPLAVMWIFWLVAWAFIPTPHRPGQASPLLRFLAYQLSSDPQIYGRCTTVCVPAACSWCCSSGLAAALSPKITASATTPPAQRQQTKWIVLGLTAAFAGA
jgi:hypothetical protein